MKVFEEEELWDAASTPRGLEGLERLAIFLGVSLPRRDGKYVRRLISAITAAEARLKWAESKSRGGWAS